MHIDLLALPLCVKQQHEMMLVIGMLIFRCWWTVKQAQMLTDEQQFENDWDIKTFLQIYFAKTAPGKFSIQWCWYSSFKLHRWVQPPLDQGANECSSFVSVLVLKASSLGIWWIHQSSLPACKHFFPKHWRSVEGERHFCHGVCKHKSELGSCKVRHDLLAPREHSELRDNCFCRGCCWHFLVYVFSFVFLMLSVVQNQTIKKNIIKAKNFVLSNSNYLIYWCVRWLKKLWKYL